MQNNVQQYQIQQPQVNVPQQCACHQSAQYAQYPQAQQSAQTVQVPSNSGVTIQIFNPSVGVPGGAPTYNVNAPQYQGCYPSGYYTNNWANGANQNVLPNTPQGSSESNNANDSSNDGKSMENKQGSDQNITTNSNNTMTNTTKEETKKTEKRDIIQLTDTYIKNLESYLNSQDKEIRMMGAKEVVARLQEDDSRRTDKALTALVNKMLQDPSQPIRFLALAMLDTRACAGDDYTVKVLEAMRNSKLGYGEDALQANEILLKMSGQPVKKEFEVTETKTKENK